MTLNGHRAIILPHTSLEGLRALLARVRACDRPCKGAASSERLPNETSHDTAELGGCREDWKVTLPIERVQPRIRQTRRDLLGRSKCDDAILAPMDDQDRRGD